ncbi:hypothetical protein JW865_01085 [Candidatus Bathyarchaeota archaeon]|nr:hypothetical protein [Candidatus Bathyarchaeota archaeon]
MPEIIVTSLNLVLVLTLVFVIFHFVFIPERWVWHGFRGELILMIKRLKKTYQKYIKKVNYQTPVPN